MLYSRGWLPPHKINQNHNFTLQANIVFNERDISPPLTNNFLGETLCSVKPDGESQMITRMIYVGTNSYYMEKNTLTLMLAFIAPMLN